VVNYTQMKKANEDLKKLYGRYGFLDMEAIPELKPDPKTRKVDIAITVNEGRQYIVRRINFAGNTNYNTQSGDVTITINPATVTMTAGSYSGTYDGSSHSISACAVTGVYTRQPDLLQQPLFSWTRCRRTSPNMSLPRMIPKNWSSRSC
jgi:hypothetical protein